MAVWTAVGKAGVAVEMAAVASAVEVLGAGTREGAGMLEERAAAAWAVARRAVAAQEAEGMAAWTVGWRVEASRVAEATGAVEAAARVVEAVGAETGEVPAAATVQCRHSR